MSNGSFVIFMFRDIHSTFWTRQFLMATSSHIGNQELLEESSWVSAQTMQVLSLVLNLDTSAITSQFHVVFDDWFTTVTTSVDNLPDFNSTTWSKMFGDSEYQFIRDEDDAEVDPEDFVTSEAISTRQNQVSKAMDTVMPPTPLPVSPPPSSPSKPSIPPSPVPSSPMSPRYPPMAVPSLSMGASPPAQHQREKSHLAQPSNRGSPQGLKTFNHLNRGSYLHQLFEDPTGHASNIPC